MSIPPPFEVPEKMTELMGYFQDGYYSRRLGQVSPEGNVYGQVRRVRTVEKAFWWDGNQWREVVPDGQTTAVSLLPTGVRPFGEMWRVQAYNAVTAQYYWEYYYWDSEQETWNKLKWYWTVDSQDELPTPGFAEGEAHLVDEPDVPVFWDGFVWRRERHSSLEDDQPDRHVPAGFLDGMQPDARLEWTSPTQIDIYAVPGGSGQVWVRTEYVTASLSCSLYNYLAALYRDPITDVVTAEYVEIETEYWIYLANNEDGWSFDALPAEGTHVETPAWNYEGKLFLSRTDPVNGYMATNGQGQNARLVGKVETDATSYTDGGPYFIRELDISLISRTVSLPETYREYSDFYLSFVSYSTLRLTRIDGTYGQIFVGGALEYLESDLEVGVTSPRIDWNDGDLLRVTTAIGTDTTYYIYLAGDGDPYNFNATNPETSRPFMPGEDGYNASLDMRKTLFLSSKEHDHGVLDGAWPGYIARWLGTVRTDAYGKFVRAMSLPSVRRPMPEAQWFDGMAEAQIEPVSDTEFQIVGKPASSKTVVVGGATVTVGTLTATNSDPVVTYVDGSEAPFTATGNTVSDYAGGSAYLYLTNSENVWGDGGQSLIWCDSAPVDGMLSQNWPGYNARWVVTVAVDADGKFTGSYVVGSGVAVQEARIDDGAISPSKTWSSDKIELTTTNNTPPGVIFDFAGTQAPVGFLLCDGAAVSRTTYAALFAAIGTTWGAGDGTTTFNVPDLCRRITIGSGGTGTTTIGASVGNTGGAETHTLSTTEMPSHNHGGATGTSIGHSYCAPGEGKFPVSACYLSDTHSHSISSQGGSGAHNNMQPSAVVLKIIKY